MAKKGISVRDSWDVYCNTLNPETWNNANIKQLHTYMVSFKHKRNLLRNTGYINHALNQTHVITCSPLQRLITAERIQQPKNPINLKHSYFNSFRNLSHLHSLIFNSFWSNRYFKLLWSLNTSNLERNW